MLKALQVDGLACVDLVLAVVLVPLGTVAFLCMFSMIAHPTPVLYAQKEISPCCVAYGMMHISVRRKS